MYLKKTERFKSVHYELSGLFFTYEYSAARAVLTWLLQRDRRALA